MNRWRIQFSRRRLARQRRVYRRTGLGLERLESRLPFAAIAWNSPVDGFWEVATNWLPPQVPGSNDDVTIDLPVVSPTITIQDSRAVNSLVSRESLIIAPTGSLQIIAAPPAGAASQIDASTLLLFGNLTASGPVNTTATGTVDWQSGTISGNGLVNLGTITISTDNPKQLNGVLNNPGTMNLRDAGTLSITDCCGFGINIQSGGLFDIQSDADTNLGQINVQTGGLLKKSVGAGGAEESRLTSQVNLLGGTIEVVTGKLTLAGANAVSSGGTLNVSAGATLDLTGNVSPIFYGGTYTGSGGGIVEIAGGALSTADPGATFDLPSGMFQWTGGRINAPGSRPFINAGAFTLAGANDKVLGGKITNQGSMTHAGEGDLLLDGSTILEVSPGALYDFAGDGDIGPSGGGAGFASFIQNDGTFRKSAGTAATSEISLPINTTATAVFEAQVGRLKLNAGGIFQGGTFNAAADAIVDLSNGAALSGDFTGSGEGRVELSGGTFGSYDVGVANAHATFDFPAGLLFWTAGGISSGGCGSGVGCGTTFVNAGSITIEGEAGKGLGGTGLINEGTIVNLGPGDFGTGGSVFTNREGATYEHRGDSNFFGTDQFGNSGRFVNAGTIEKTAGLGTVDITSKIENAATGVIDVQSGRLKFSRGGNSTGGTFNMSAGATLEFGCRTETFCDVFGMSNTFTGTGPGTVEFFALLNGVDGANPARLDFPPGVFRMLGGQLLGSIVNEDTFDFAPPTGLFARAGITNNGTWIHSGAGDFVLNANSRFINNGLYDLRTDADFVVPGDASGGTMFFLNTSTGTLRKSDGLGTSSFRHDGSSKELRFDNTGTLEVQAGTVEFQDPVTQFAGSTLGAGTWIAREFSTIAAPNATNFTTNNAQVTLDGPNSNFARINSLATNNGSFSLAGGRDFATAGNLTNSGELNVGPNSVLTVNGTLTENPVDRLIGWWRGEDNADDSASTMDGTLNGDTAFAAGQFGQSFSFDGDGDFVALDNPTALRLQEFTISAWIKRGDLEKSGQIFGYGQSGYGFGIFGDGKLFLTQVGVDHVQTSNLLIDDTDFHHVAVTKSGSTVTFYIDGVAEVTGPYSRPFNFFTNAAIGSRAESSDPFWPFLGQIDEVAVFSRPLTAAEVQALRANNDPAVIGNIPPEINVAIAGRPRTGKFGQVKVTGEAILDGTLNLDRVDGFGPTPNDKYEIMSFASHTGTFDAIQGAAPFFDATVNATNVMLNVRSDGPTYDLDVDAITIPASGRPGASATITYSVQNLSANDLGGTWIDSLYLSRDITFSPDDLLIGRVEHRGGVAALATYNESLEAALPPVTNDDYHVIVIADSRGWVPDPDRSNNTAASSGTVAVASQPLTFDIATTGTIANGQDIYFRLDVPAGRDVRFTANFAEMNGAEFFVRYREMPTRSEFDFSSNDPTQLQRTITLAGPQAGPYYVLIHGREAAGEGMAFDIKPERLAAAINSVAPLRGANLGDVTVTIRGSGFTPDTTAALINASGGVANTATVRFADSNTLFATFDLEGMAAGAYDVRTTTDGVHSELDNAFTVFAGVPGRVETHLATPGTVRAGRLYRAIIEYSNTGDTDVIAPLFFLSAPGSNLRLVENGRFVGERLQLLGINRSGPAGVLPPGARGQIPVEFLAAGPIMMKLETLSDPNASVDWGPCEEGLRPPLTPEDSWSAIFGNLMQTVGTTAGKFQETLADDATYLSQFGIYTADVQRLLAFELEQASAFGDIFDRYKVGPFGRGVTDPFDIEAISDPSNNITIRYGSDIRSFTRQPDGSYRGEGIDKATLTKLGGIVRLREVDGVTVQFLANGKLDFIEDVRGNKTTANYTGDRLTSVVNPVGDTLTYVYNAQGRVGQLIEPNGRTINYEYDASGEHITRVSNPNGTTDFTYVTGQGEAKEHALASITSDDGTHVFLDYDDRGRVIHVEGDSDIESLGVSYDSAGSILLTNSDDEQLTMFLNEFKGISGVRDPFGHFNGFAYDSFGNLTRARSSTGETTTSEYDDRGNAISVTDALGAEIGFGYDQSFNQLMTLRDPRGNSIGYTVEADGNITAVTYNDGNTLTYTYDADGRVTNFVNARSQEVQYDYDADGLLMNKTFEDGSHVDYEYDAHRNVTQATEVNGMVMRVTMFDYDAADRLTRVDYPNGRFVEIDYDSAGRRTQIRDQSAFEVNYVYDALGRLTQLKNAGGQALVTYTFDEFGRLTRVDRLNGTSTAYSFDAGDQVITVNTRGPDNTLISQFDYIYDNAGRRTAMNSPQGLFQYEYDAGSQLTQVSAPGGRVIQYSYDESGNRISVVDNGVPTNYGVNTLNQYTGVGTSTFAYDADGNLVSRTDASGTTTYDYDAESHLTQITTPTDVWQFEYDVFGNRVATDHNGQRTEYLIDPVLSGDVLSTYDGTGATTAHFLHGLGLEAQVDPMNVAAFYNFDGNGNTAELTGTAGTVLNSYAYLPFGELLQASETVVTPFKFVGRFGVMNDVPGLNFTQNRAYDPSLGRFIERDPIGPQGGDFNLYRYLNNSPTNGVDPSGLMGEQEAIEIISEVRAGLYKGLLGNPYIDNLVSEARKVVVASREATLAALAREREIKGAQAVGDFVQGLLNKKPPLPKPPGPSIPAAPPVAPATAPVTGGAPAAAGRPFLHGLRSALTPRNILTALNPVNIVKATLKSPTFWGALAGSSIIDATVPTIEAEKHRNDPLGPLGNPAFGPQGREHLRDCLEELASGMVSERCRRILNAIGFGGSNDPNEIVGPGAFVLPNQTLPYQIHFENLATATAPAVEVFVTQQLDSDLDWSTFELGDFGFGSLTIQVPAGRNSYSTRVNLPASPETGGEDLLVDITVDLNLTTGLVSWTFRAIDPDTGDLPENALAGFLPPNTAPPIGTGFVSYSVRTRDVLPTGTRVDAEARIVFDTNEPLDTAPIFSTIDAEAPVSSVAELPVRVNQTAFLVNWSGADDAGGTAGSGVATFNVYVSDNNGPFVPLVLATPEQSFLFHGEVNHSYRFYSEATDNLGQREEKTAQAEATVMILDGPEWQNAIEPKDVDRDDFIVPLDVLIIFNELNDPQFSHPGTRLLNPRTGTEQFFYDVNGDDFVTPLDSLIIINFLNDPTGEGESERIPAALALSPAHLDMLVVCPEGPLADGSYRLTADSASEQQLPNQSLVLTAAPVRRAPLQTTVPAPGPDEFWDNLGPDEWEQFLDGLAADVLAAG